MEHKVSPEESQTRHGVFLPPITINPAKEQVQVSILGHKGHGKTTLTAAISRVLAKANRLDTYATFDQIEQGLDERQSVTAITCSRVAYTDGARQYLHADYVNRTDILKGLIMGYYPLDGAILVISTLDGPTPQTRELLLLAQRMRIPALAVFLNQFAAQEDEELRAVVDLEVRELLSIYHIQSGNIPIIRGSAFDAMKSQGDLSRTDAATRCIWELLDAMNTYIPIPVKPIDKPFLMAVEDMFSLKGRGTIAVGRIERGQIKVGDGIEIVGMQDEKCTSAILGIEMFQKTLKRAQVGDNIGCLLEGIGRNEISRGQVLAQPGSIRIYKIFKAQVYILAKEEGGRHTPFRNGYRTCFYVRTTDIVGAVSLPDDIEKVLPGEQVEIQVELCIPMALEEGTRFAIREGGRTVGVGVCTSLLG